MKHLEALGIKVMNKEFEIAKFFKKLNRYGNNFSYIYFFWKGHQDLF